MTLVIATYPGIDAGGWDGTKRECPAVRPSIRSKMVFFYGTRTTDVRFSSDGRAGLFCALLLLTMEFASLVHRAASRVHRRGRDSSRAASVPQADEEDVAKDGLLSSLVCSTDTRLWTRTSR